MCLCVNLQLPLDSHPSGEMSLFVPGEFKGEKAMAMRVAYLHADLYTPLNTAYLCVLDMEYMT